MLVPSSSRVGSNACLPANVTVASRRLPSLCNSTGVQRGLSTENTCPEQPEGGRESHPRERPSGHTAPGQQRSEDPGDGHRLRRSLHRGLHTPRAATTGETSHAGQDAPAPSRLHRATSSRRPALGRRPPPGRRRPCRGPGPAPSGRSFPARSPPPAAARVALPSLKPGYLEARAAEHFTQGPRSQRARCSGSLSFSRSTW